MSDSDGKMEMKNSFDSIHKQDYINHHNVNEKVKSCRRVILKKYMKNEIAIGNKNLLTLKILFSANKKKLIFSLISPVVLSAS